MAALRALTVWSRGSEKGQRVSILGFAGWIVSGVTARFCHFAAKAATGNRQTNQG